VETPRGREREKDRDRGKEREKERGRETNRVRERGKERGGYWRRWSSRKHNLKAVDYPVPPRMFLNTRGRAPRTDNRALPWNTAPDRFTLVRWERSKRAETTSRCCEEYIDRRTGRGSVVACLSEVKLRRDSRGRSPNGFHFRIKFQRGIPFPRVRRKSSKINIWFIKLRIIYALTNLRIQFSLYSRSIRKKTFFLLPGSRSYGLEFVLTADNWS